MSEFINDNTWYSAENTETQSAPAAVKSENKLGKKIIALVLGCSLLSACAGFGGAMLASNTSKSNTTVKYPDNAALSSLYMSNRQNAVVNAVSINSASELTTAEVYAANVNSTVGIKTEITTTNAWGYTSSAAASGSGFIITSDGYIVTNYHVIEDANAITVSMYDGTEMEAKIAGYDQNKDLAVLKVDATDLVPVVIGDSDKLNVGDDVIAIGNPLGELTFSVTKGIVSAKDREITMSSGSTMNLMQTDCTINSGNSGGALFNMYGEVIGITNAKYSGNSSSGASIDNIGFAIPINSVMHLISQVIEKGYITYPYIGVSVTTVSAESKAYGVPAGAAIAAVTENGPAAKAGIAVNDIITAFDGNAIETSSEIVEFVGKTSPDEEHVFTIYRQGEYLEITVTIGQKEQTTEATSQSSQQSSKSGSSNSSGGYGNFGGSSGYGSYSFPGGQG